MEAYLGVSKEVGLSNEEIGTVQAIVMAVSAARVRAHFREVRRKMSGGDKPGRAGG